MCSCAAGVHIVRVLTTVSECCRFMGLNPGLVGHFLHLSPQCQTLADLVSSLSQKKKKKKEVMCATGVHVVKFSQWPKF